MDTKLTLRQFIEAREAEIKSLRAELLAELKELKAAKSAISTDSIDKDSPANSGVKTIKQKIIDVLTDSDLPLTSEEIISEIKTRFGDDVARTSLSPQLSRLKNDDKMIGYNELSKSWSLGKHGPQVEHSHVSTVFD